MTEDTSLKKLDLNTKIGFGAAEFSSSLTWTMSSLLFLFFLTDVVGLDPAFAGFILMLGTLWDAITDPAIGIASDRSRSKWGRRRPFLLATALPFGLATWLLFTNPGFDELTTKIYFILVIIFYYTCATLLEVPYTSLTAEMTQDYNERARLISFRAVFSQIGSIVGAASPWLLIAYFTKMTGDVTDAWSITAALFGIVTVFPILWTWCATKGHELNNSDVSVSLSDLINGPLKNRTFRYTMATLAAGNIALGASGSVAVYFMKYFMNFDETQQSTAYFFLFSCTLIWIPVITFVTTRFGKRLSFILFVGTWALVQSVGIMIIEPSQVFFFYVLMILASGGIVSITLTGLSMVPDAIEVDEFKSGLRREGLYIGVNMFVRKFFTALALWVVGIVLSEVGYIPDQVQSESTLMGIKSLYALGTAFFLIISITLAFFIPMTGERHAALRQAIKNKQAGIPWDQQKIENLL